MLTVTSFLAFYFSFFPFFLLPPGAPGKKEGKNEKLRKLVTVSFFGRKIPKRLRFLFFLPKVLTIINFLSFSFFHFSFYLHFSRSPGEGGRKKGGQEKWKNWEKLWMSALLEWKYQKKTLAFWYFPPKVQRVTGFLTFSFFLFSSSLPGSSGRGDFNYIDNALTTTITTMLMFSLGLLISYPVRPWGKPLAVVLVVELRRASWSDCIGFRRPTAGQDECLHGGVHSCWGEPGMQVEQAKLTSSATQNQIDTAVIKNKQTCPGHSSWPGLLASGRPT